MATLNVEPDGTFSCNGIHQCGGSSFRGKSEIIRCFNCESCPSFKRDGLKIINRKGQQGLNVFMN